ncbi:MAG: hypothetical protein KKA67_01920 [Spirochaetes bacterium]|nr:hypothetical protein [Spirochaetota bacterium]MBU1079052.1 hypothetical protein [Spirochaetota bacterium]
MVRNFRIAPTLLAALGIASACACSNLYLDAWFGGEAGVGVTVVVEDAIYQELEPSLVQYLEDLEAAGHEARVIRFPGGGAPALRAAVWSVGAERDPAFLVGDLPYATFRMEAFGNIETFPVDLFFADEGCAWYDADGDGIFDSHGPLLARKPVSRVSGSAEELAFYFRKLHEYRSGASADSDEAFIFKDDDWQGYRRGSGFGLERIFPRVVIFEGEADTDRAGYVSKLSSRPSAYVYQWVHASPDTLFFAVPAGYEPFTISDIPEAPPQGLFYNLFNCKAARFVSPNLGMRYLTETPYGLAVQGSTKIGGNYYPVEFHRSLARGRTWAQAHADWYNLYGVESDEWFLGMAVLGCPVVRLPGAKARGYATNGYAASGATTARGLPSEIPEPFSDEPELFEGLVRFSESLGE